MASTIQPSTRRSKYGGRPGANHYDDSQICGRDTDECVPALVRLDPLLVYGNYLQHRNGDESDLPARLPEQPEPRSVGKSPCERIDPWKLFQTPPQVKQSVQALSWIVKVCGSISCRCPCCSGVGMAFSDTCACTLNTVDRTKTATKPKIVTAQESFRFIKSPF